MKSIVLASHNPVKTQATRAGFQSMFPDLEFVVSEVSVPSGVSEQPLTDEETLRGAVNRAQAAKDLVHPKLYKELARWWPVLSSPSDYAEEAAFYRQTMISCSLEPPITLLELGCGGGNNASYLKEQFNLVLVDLSSQMLEVSRSLNPECEHIQGDMRTLRLGKQFDAVFIHDAIGYMTTEMDLRDAIKTAYVHCTPGGVALFAPDFVNETFQPSTKQGGHDLDTRSLRYLAWTWDPDPNDITYFTDFAYLLREGRQDVRCVYDRHILGLFRRDDWLEWLREVGFQARRIPFNHSEVEVIGDVFVGTKPADDT